MQPHPRGTNHFSELYIHPVVTVHQVAIVSFPILQLYQLEQVKVQRSNTRRQVQRSKYKTGAKYMVLYFTVP